MQTVCGRDGRHQHHLDPNDREHAGWTAVHLHPGNRCLHGAAYSCRLSVCCVVETGQRAGTCMARSVLTRVVSDLARSDTPNIT